MAMMHPYPLFPLPLDYSERLSRRFRSLDNNDEPDEIPVTCTRIVYIIVDHHKCDSNYSCSSSYAGYEDEDGECEEIIQEPPFKMWHCSMRQRGCFCHEPAKNLFRRVPFRTQHFYRPSQPHG